MSKSRPPIYFCIREVNSHYKGVKGEGVVTIANDLQSVISISDRVIIKYLSILDNPGARAISERSNSGEGIIIEITSKFFSTGDFDKISTP
jgi:hypothetical protein